MRLEANIHVYAIYNINVIFLGFHYKDWNFLSLPRVHSETIG